MHFVVWTSSLSHVRKDGEKNENMTLCLSLALVTKKERVSMSKTKPNQKKKKKEWNYGGSERRGFIFPIIFFWQFATSLACFLIEIIVYPDQYWMSFFLIWLEIWMQIQIILQLKKHKEKAWQLSGIFKFL